jgi:hypothetical protein
MAREVHHFTHHALIYLLYPLAFVGTDGKRSDAVHGADLRCRWQRRILFVYDLSISGSAFFSPPPYHVAKAHLESLISTTILQGD